MLDVNDLLSATAPAFIERNLFLPEYFDQDRFRGDWKVMLDPLFDLKFQQRLLGLKKSRPFNAFWIQAENLREAQPVSLDIGVPDLNCGRYITALDTRFVMYNAFGDVAVFNSAGGIAEQLFHRRWDDL